MSSNDVSRLHALLCVHGSMTSSSHYVDTFITGNRDNGTVSTTTMPETKQHVDNDAITVTDNLTIPDVAGVSDTKSPKSRAASNSSTSKRIHTTRRSIAETIESMERETDELRESNRRLIAEGNDLRRENSELHRELEQVRRERAVAQRKVDELTGEVQRLEVELDDRRREFELEAIKVEEKERQLKDMTSLCDELRVELDRKSADWKSFIERHNEEIRAGIVERDSLKARLEQLSVPNLTPRSLKTKESARGGIVVDVEMQHQLDTLKQDRREIAAVRDQLTRENLKLTVELQNLATVLANRENELRNERTRHVLLTRQFNSLLDENTSLKERRQVKSIKQVNSNPMISDSTTWRNASNSTRTSGLSECNKNKIDVGSDFRSTAGSESSTLTSSRRSRETTRDLINVSSSRGQTPEVTDRYLLASSRSAAASGSRLRRHNSTSTHVTVRRIRVKSPSNSSSGAASVPISSSATASVVNPEAAQLPAIPSAEGGVISRKWLS